LNKSNDQDLFTEITRCEHTIAVAEIKKLGWKPALAASQKRQDDMARLIVSTASPGIACQAGCWYCCYYKVDAHAEEVLLIAEYVRAKFSPERIKQLKQDVAHNAQSLRTLSGSEQLQANLKCALLDDGKCSVYDVRPSRCKTFHARDVAGCKQSYEQPTNLSISNSFIPELFYAGEAHLKGFRQAIKESDYDTSVYELNAALEMALADSTPKRRFEKRKKAFAALHDN
jgi:Fe-S-cluster containining protein